MKEIHGIDWLELLEKYGLKLLAAVSIFLIGMWLAKRSERGNGSVGRVLRR